MTVMNWVQPITLLLLTIVGFALVVKGARSGKRPLQLAGLLFIFAAALSLGLLLSRID